MSKSGKSTKALQGLHASSSKPSSPPKGGAKKGKVENDPIKGLKNAVKAKQVAALAMEAALQSGGGR